MGKCVMHLFSNGGSKMVHILKNKALAMSHFIEPSRERLLLSCGQLPILIWTGGL